MIGRKPEEPDSLSLYGVKDYKKSRKERDILRAKRYQGRTNSNNNYTQRRLPQARRLLPQTRRLPPQARRLPPQTRRVQYARPIRRGGSKIEDDLDDLDDKENDYEKESSLVE